jgi:hypothetical protein
MFRTKKDGTGVALIVQGAHGQNNHADAASVLFQNKDSDTGLVYDMVQLACRDAYGNATQNGYGEFIVRTRDGTLLTEQLRLTHEGFLGLGKTNPACRLDVWGDANVSGTLTASNLCEGGVTLSQKYQLAGLQQMSQASGGLLGLRAVTSGTQYTPTAGTRVIVAHVLGGGGGGGGCASGVSMAAAAGGGAGGQCTAYVTLPMTYTSFPVSVGAGGTAGSIAGGVGATGGGSSLTVSNVAYAGQGGQGGCGVNDDTEFIIGGVGGATSHSVAAFYGQCGQNGGGDNSGAGGSCAFGRGGAGRPSYHNGCGNTSGDNGDAGQGYGSGGSGAVSQRHASRTGGAGAQGIILIYEYA